MALETLTAATGILGGLKKAFGGGGPSASEQSYGALKGAFQAADKYGLHRLAVAGSPAGYSPAPASSADGLLDVSNALRGYTEDKRSKSLDAKSEQLIDAQIQEARSRTVLNEANAKRALAGPQPGLGSASGNLVAFDRASNGGERTVRVEPQPDLAATQQITFGNQSGRGPNPEAFEMGLSELAAGLLIYGPQWLYNWKPKGKNNRPARGRSSQPIRQGGKSRRTGNG